MRENLTQRINKIYKIQEEKAALVEDHRSEIDSMTKRLRQAEQHYLDELNRLKYEFLRPTIASFCAQEFDPLAITIQKPSYEPSIAEGTIHPSAIPSTRPPTERAHPWPTTSTSRTDVRKFVTYIRTETGFKHGTTSESFYDSVHPSYSYCPAKS